MIKTLFTSPLAFFITAIGLLLAITIHEFAHALAADTLGDPNPRSQNRVSLNPLVHLDPLGTAMLLFFGFGWGKPVNFDPHNLRNPRKDIALISLAGPASNVVLAIILSLVAKLIAPPVISGLLYPLIYINLVLAIFNLVPVFPLDGEKILSGLLPRNLSFEYQSIMQRYGTLILILLVLPVFGSSPIVSLISPIVSFVFSLLT
jgi:Zn-dependent protease